MNSFPEIAHAAVSNRLCLFVGTGFSKAITSNAAPGWQDLLYRACDFLDDPTILRSSLFPSNGGNPVSLEESAQIIAIHLNKDGKCLHEVVRTILSSIELSGDNSDIEAFFNENTVNIITTNYDKLTEKLTGDCNSFSPGLPMPRLGSITNIYHIHGSIDFPSAMVVTSDDYFDFMSKETYFSRKLSTLLHENTVVILGYSLSDSNLKLIFNEQNRMSKTQFNIKRIFFVARGLIAEPVKDYYYHCYGIMVMDGTDIHYFFYMLNNEIQCFKDRARPGNSYNTLARELESSLMYLENEYYFPEIMSSISAAGKGVGDDDIVGLLEKVFSHKIALTKTGGWKSWEQNVHLARWLAHLGSISDISDTGMKNFYLETVLYSMKNMGKGGNGNRSFQTYMAWIEGWRDVTLKNKKSIQEYIHSKSDNTDAIELVDSENGWDAFCKPGRT